MRSELAEFIKRRKKGNLAMIAANLAVFVILEILGSTRDVEFMAGHGAMYVPWVQAYGEWYRLVTSMFLHFGIQHLFYNMFLLIFVGDMLETEVGKLCYLIIYLGGGAAGNLLSMAVSMHRGQYAVSAGASGAVFAVIGALVAIVLRSRNQVHGINGRRLALMAVLSLAQGVTQTGVDHMAHLGGFLGGALLGAVCWRRHHHE